MISLSCVSTVKVMGVLTYTNDTAESRDGADLCLAGKLLALQLVTHDLRRVYVRAANAYEIHVDSR